MLLRPALDKAARDLRQLPNHSISQSQGSFPGRTGPMGVGEVTGTQGVGRGHLALWLVPSGFFTKLFLTLINGRLYNAILMGIIGIGDLGLRIKTNLSNSKYFIFTRKNSLSWPPLYIHSGMFTLYKPNLCIITATYNLHKLINFMLTTKHGYRDLQFYM